MFLLNWGKHHHNESQQILSDHYLTDRKLHFYFHEILNGNSIKKKGYHVLVWSEISIYEHTSILSILLLSLLSDIEVRNSSIVTTLWCTWISAQLWPVYIKERP